MPQYLIRIVLQKKTAGTEASHLDYDMLHRNLSKIDVSRFCWSLSKQKFFHLPPATYGIISDSNSADLFAAIEIVVRQIWPGPVEIVMAQEASLMQASGLDVFTDTLGVEPKHVIDVV